MSGPGLHRFAAAVLVFGASASVLVVEIVALRLLAPYLGLTLETSTLVIGIALAAIALGSWSGGRLADRIPPRRALGPLLAISGVAVALTPVVVRAAGGLADGVVMIAVTLALIVPGTLLAAVTPMVIKLRLSSLAETGTVVGQLSALGTAGAIVGTVVTGFVLISRVPVSGILVGLGITLAVAAALVEWRFRRSRAAVVPALLVLLGGVGAVVVSGPCDVETAYHCAVVRTDAERASGRILLLDGAQHSYVDLDDPTFIKYDYAKALVAAVDTAFPAARPLRAYHLGGGGLTVPRYLERTRPGTSSRVSEIDPGVVAVDRNQLRLPPDARIDLRIEDGRLGLRQIGADSQDLVVGDAFGGVSVPWHLTTREAVAEVDRVLAGDGLYVLNLIDFGPLAFARAEARTLAAVFPHVALATETDTLTGGPKGGGNVVLMASARPIDVAAVQTRVRSAGADWSVITGPGLGSWIGDAPVLTDDFAPVDQLLTPYPTRRLTAR